ncbi:protein DpdG [Sphingomonas sp. VNH70]|uniref:protein DpdG n=1 Tax=Sphingomonas silueang TaxID=3156617 RepID=UPI0032B3C39E
MSIVTTFEAVPSRLYAIYAALFDSESGEVKDRLEAWATPPSLRNRGGEEGESTTTLFSNTLAEARRIGLVEEIDGKLRLTSDARGGGKKGRDSETYFRAYMRRTLFDPTRAADTRQSGYMTALSWFLSTSPLRPMNFSKEPINELRALIGDHASKFEIADYAGWQSFLYWSRYLGFATIVGGGNNAEDLTTRRVIPDPLEAIEGALPAIFAETNELPVEQFVTRLAAIFPVFETGSARQDFEGMRLTPLVDGDKRLSIATSLALQRLSDRQRLTMTSVADAAARILDFGSREGRVSRIALRDAA